MGRRFERERIMTLCLQNRMSFVTQFTEKVLESPAATAFGFHHAAR